MSLLNAFFMLALLFVSLILVLLILVQRGKGGGLAGALGGMGGQSAFGSKAGDTFTRITIGLAILWFVLCLAAVSVLKPDERFKLPTAQPTAPASTDAKAPASTDAKAPASSDKPAK